MLRPITTRTDLRFVPSSEASEDVQTTLLFRAMSKEEFAAVMDALEPVRRMSVAAHEGIEDERKASVDLLPVKKHQIIVDTFRMCMTGVENFELGGKPVTVTDKPECRTAFGLHRPCVDMAVTSLFSMSVVNEAFAWLLAESTLSEADRGNS